jgi:predicted nucleic acid-binding protein
MGLMVDTNVFIKFEKTRAAIDFSAWESTANVSISVVAVSELLIGVQRADTEERRKRRSAFVEAIISSIDILDFTLEVPGSCGNLW